MDKKFSGFSSKAPAIPVPNQFFTELIGQIDDIYELKLTLCLLWAMKVKVKSQRYISLKQIADLCNEIGLQISNNKISNEELEKILNKAVERGTLIKACIKYNEKEENVYLINTDKDREWIQKYIDGDTASKNFEIRLIDSDTIKPLPDIFTLYEQNIGIISPIIAEDLKRAEELYPSQWINDAFREAVQLNKRSWRYILRILERWSAEGKLDGKTGRYSEKEKDPGRFIRGKFGHMVRR